MRSDRNLPPEFRDQKQWTIDPLTGTSRPDYERLDTYGPEFHRHSYSGNERNKLFLNQQGKRFIDVSDISGADDIADSRSWARWDFNRDGWQDIALVNANKPLLRLFQNQLNSERRAPNRFVAVRLNGANSTPTPSKTSSNRDGFGAVVNVRSGGLKIRREHRCGEGYAAQNSSTMLIGIGQETEAELSIAWPSGAQAGPFTVKAGQLIHCFEDTAVSPSATPTVVHDYVLNGASSDK